LVKEDLQEEGKGLDSQEMKEVVEQLEALEARDKQREQTRHQIELERKVNSEDMCSTSVSRTMVTSSKLNDDLESPDMGFEEYTTKHKEKLEAFRDWAKAQKRSYEEMEEYVSQHPVLLHQWATGWTLMETYTLVQTGEVIQAEFVCRVMHVVDTVMDLAGAKKKHPRDAVHSFFEKLHSREVARDHEEHFHKYFANVRERAMIVLKEKQEQAAAEEEEEQPLSKEERLGPGGLDPVEVFPQLPKELQDAYQEGSIERLKDYLEAQPKDEAMRILNLMIDSGLWVPGD